MRPGSSLEIYGSLMLGLLLYLLPWAGFGLTLRPDFVLLVLLYWHIRAPHSCNVGVAWMMGIVIDLADGSLFGQHAMAYIVAAFLALAYQRRVTLFSRLQQAGFVFALLIIAQIVLFIVKLFSGNQPSGWTYFLPSVTGIMLWQLVIYSKIKVSGDENRG
ncbi:MAG: rod shape-determining protein MreD [Methylophilaceae bacterium]